MYLRAIVGLLIFFVFAMVLLVGNIVFSGFMDEFQESHDYDERVDESVDDVSERLPGSLDQVSLLVISGLIIGGIVASLFVDVHPVFFGILVFISLSLLFGPMLLGNMWSDLVEEPDIAEGAANMPVTNFLLQNYLWLWLSTNALYMFIILVRDRI